MGISKIQWTDYTFNPWRGCSKVNAGCTNCYAETNRAVVAHGTKWGTEKQGGTRTVAAEGTWKEPKRWNEKAKPKLAGECLDCGTAQAGGFYCNCTTRPRVFCASLADVFEDWQGPMVDHLGKTLKQCLSCGYFYNAGSMTSEDHGCRLFNSQLVTISDVRARLFRLIDDTPNLDWLLLTKRPENIRDMWPYITKDCPRCGYSNCSCDLLRKMENVWLGTSVADQQTADQAIPELLKCRDLCSKLFLSVEPLVGPVDLSRLDIGHLDSLFNCLTCQSWDSSGLYSHCDDEFGQIDWVIIGGESGPNARPCNVEWIRSIVQQCKAASVPCFVKQLGAAPIVPGYDESFAATTVESVLTLKHPKGGDPDEWPEDLRVREFPCEQ